MGIKNGIKHDLVVRQQEKGHLFRWDWLMTIELMTDMERSTLGNGHQQHGLYVKCYAAMNEAWEIAQEKMDAG